MEIGYEKPNLTPQDKNLIRKFNFLFFLLNIRLKTTGKKMYSVGESFALHAIDSPLSKSIKSPC
jgi:hypothetical protein